MDSNLFISADAEGSHSVAGCKTDFLKKKKKATQRSNLGTQPISNVKTCQVENDQYLNFDISTKQTLWAKFTLSRLTLDQPTFGEDGCLSG